MTEKCEVPYPAAAPVSVEGRQNHCYRGGKCWWYEGGICFCPNPDNPRYPHLFGRKKLSLIPEEERSEIRISADMLILCKEQKWKIPYWSIIPLENCFLDHGEWCGELAPTETCSADDGVYLLEWDIDEEIENSDLDDEWK